MTATGENGYLSQVMGLVNQAQNDKSKAELLSDKVAGYLFYFASKYWPDFIYRMDAYSKQRRFRT
ncbi:cation-transporting ATPase E1-E2 family protein [Staphylococcus aureus]|nr:cation-transporting ATPase E1-E2 family protein [Staphylococcus aureus]